LESLTAPRRRAGATERPPPQALDRPETLAEAAYERLSEGIMDGLFRPDDRVATRKIAADLGVSATPAREAMLRLVQEGALELLNARAIVVPRLTPSRFAEVYQLRFALEPMAARIGTQNLDADALKQLQRTQDRMAAAYRRQDYHAVFRENREFHFRLYAASAMPLVTSFIRAAWLRVGPTFRLIYPTLAVAEDAIAVHDDVIAAAKAGDGDALAEAVRRDLERGRGLLARVIAPG
jgi:DNA-binding GntR family transcriptional regulator